jgi:hypothetical protein
MYSLKKPDWQSFFQTLSGFFGKEIGTLMTQMQAGRISCKINIPAG